MTAWRTNTGALYLAIDEFEINLPGWWWSVGMCSVSGDASCGVDRQGPDAHLLEGIPHGHPFDAGFHADIRSGQPATALKNVMQQAMKARALHIRRQGGTK
jgi:hypothetical protein